MKISESFNMRWKKKNIQRWKKKIERLRQKNVSKEERGGAQSNNGYR